MKTWTLTIARNASIDKKRQILRKQDILPLDQAKEQATYDRYLEKEQFLVLIGSLSAEDQLIFLNHYFYKETPQEISTLLSIDVSQVYNHLSRGRKKLKAVLEKEGYNGEYF
ncbi:hypothetical protein A5888_000571 [Enterococcus sp. 9E7_DIV0242]|uniref:RNA polymerase sigma factor 70 region 4 type 2 domain-containing protein n=1 Tax=Candidatus Enterococcus clewellii TaxID=1834193 RepID=A0A242KE20_9ENTE|nr:hypothetical protein A5888_000604 [Enterococcus sp. 9E7_DIV0242]